MNTLTLKGLSLDIHWKAPDANYRAIEKAFAESHADLYVLPEMFTTGFCMDPEAIADRHGRTLAWMKQFAQAKKAALCGSLSVEENGRFYNRMYFVEPCGKSTFYDKRHLFSYSGEHEIYTPGNQRIIVNYLGIRILLQICYDLRFPVFSRNNDDYDLALYVANWPEKRVDAWEHLLKARAIENQCYVFGLNRTGQDGNNLFYKESSHAFFADGSEITEKENLHITAKIDLEQLAAFRRKFQFLNDRDSFALLT
ncbi:nitrilase-related carbon-nitrogen hydrolase [Bergeyella sp. RCAD1439]|uniref:nitrilase-related carbon-nitrogen hydrolase n=1 Tax=Bergeyella anatis TaxID=3113737 RepID=UPI002E16BA5E|nr:nitrilase-related carbon-nitrogen hydrolase [Bergeyella sp. RCAD1439]